MLVSLLGLLWLRGRGGRQSGRWPVVVPP